MFYISDFVVILLEYISLSYRSKKTVFSANISFNIWFKVNDEATSNTIITFSPYILKYINSIIYVYSSVHMYI